MKTVVGIVAAVGLVAACTKRSPEFCCTSEDNCAAVASDVPVPCDEGFTCVPDLHTCVRIGCGDGVLDADEVCDDGNNANDDGCDASCSIASCFVPVTHPTITSAVADGSCSRLEVYSGTYIENLDLGRDIAIVGVGAMPVIISPSEQGASVVTARSGVIQLESLTVTGGRASTGAGITSTATLRLHSVRVEANIAEGPEPRGGGIYSETGAITLEDCEITGNGAALTASDLAAPEAAGAGVYIASGSATINGGRISSNTIGGEPAANLAARGAGVASATDLSINNTEVSANTIDVDGAKGSAIAEGAGIAVVGANLTLLNATVNGNMLTVRGSAPTARGGGLAAAAIQADGSEISGNRVTAFGMTTMSAAGGGAYVAGQAPSRITASVLANNEVNFQCSCDGVDGYGGGLAAYGDDAVEMQTSVVQGNTVRGSGTEFSGLGGGIYWHPSAVASNRTLEVLQTTVSDNLVDASFSIGGGIAADLPSTGDLLVIRQSTISSNELRHVQGGYGAGVGFYGSQPGTRNTLAIVNSTISSNDALSASDSWGGGVWATSTDLNVTLLVFSATIANNRATLGGGIYRGGNAASTVENTLVSGNQGGACDSTDPTRGFSLFTLYDVTPTCLVAAGDGDQVGASANLGQLGDNGGSTQTHALLPGSHAIDMGSGAGCVDEAGAILEVDQRGMPRTNNGRCDVGAFER